MNRADVSLKTWHKPLKSVIQMRLNVAIEKKVFVSYWIGMDDGTSTRAERLSFARRTGGTHKGILQGGRSWLKHEG